MLSAQVLAQRVLSDQRLELAHHVAMMPEREVRFDPPFERGNPQLLEARALVPREGLRELGQCAPAPERERGTQQLSRLLGMALREGPPGVGDRALEARQVQLVVPNLEQVAGRARVQTGLRKRLPQLRDLYLHHLLRRLRDALAPQGVDDLVAAHAAVGVKQQDRQQRALLPCRDGQGRAASEDL